MKQYVGRSLRYLIKLAVLLAVIYALMFATGMTGISAEMFWNELFATRRGLALLGALVILGLLYPRFGFVKRDVKADIGRDMEEIVKAFHLDGYTMTDRKDGEMTFRAASLSKRLLNAFDDKIVLTYDDDKYITLDGIRKEVVQVAFRITSYVENKTDKNED